MPIIGCSIPKSLGIIVPGYKQCNLTFLKLQLPFHKPLYDICIFIVKNSTTLFCIKLNKFQCGMA